jgi:hypothetical protein
MGSKAPSVVHSNAHFEHLQQMRDDHEFLNEELATPFYSSKSLRSDVTAATTTTTTTTSGGASQAAASTVPGA